MIRYLVVFLFLAVSSNALASDCPLGDCHATSPVNNIFDSIEGSYDKSEKGLNVNDYSLWEQQTVEKEVYSKNFIETEEIKTTVSLKNYTPQTNNVDYNYIHRGCQNFAPISFEYVDFRIKKPNSYEAFGNKLGNYRFRIFGCRRTDKEAYLNVGRTMQKDMTFFDTFNKVYGDCFTQVKMPTDLCDESNQNQFPEYILTAEITDYFMNVCDEYDWNKTKQKDERKGTSEITITWRLMDIGKNNVYWKGETSGYGELEYGEVNGELLLVDRAFEDALTDLRSLPGFEAQLATRQTPSEMQEHKKQLAALEKAVNPVKCQYGKEIDAIEMAKAEEKCPTCPECPGADKTTVTTDTTSISEFEEDSGLIGNGKITNEQNFSLDETSGFVSTGSEISDGGALTGRGNSQDFASDSFGNKDNVRIVEDVWIDIPLNDPSNKQALENRKIVENSFVKSQGSFCVENQLTFKRMNPENLYKVRASIVDISNKSGQNGVGLIINEQFVLTSADLINKNDNNFDVKTINGKKFKASAFRVSPNKNVALLLLQEKTEYTPLTLNLDLPPVGMKGFMTLGLNLEDGGEGYVDDSTQITGYRFSPAMGAEIQTNKHTQNQTLGGALIDTKGNLYGMAHYGKRLSNEADRFIPIEAALKSLNIEICGRQFLNKEPWQKSSIEEVKAKAPKAMNKKERK